MPSLWAIDADENTAFGANRGHPHMSHRHLEAGLDYRSMVATKQAYAKCRLLQEQISLRHMPS